MDVNQELIHDRRIVVYEHGEGWAYDVVDHTAGDAADTHTGLDTREAAEAEARAAYPQAPVVYRRPLPDDAPDWLRAQLDAGEDA